MEQAAHIIVPIAGPDYISASGSIKGLQPMRGQPLLKHILDSRPWMDTESRVTFVSYDCGTMRAFITEDVQSWYPHARCIYVGNYTRGAALTALAGAAHLESFDTPVLIDLADIYCEVDTDVFQAFSQNANTGACALCFESDSPAYSYLRFEAGSFVEAAEKRVISSTASAGIYVFRNLPIFLRAIAYLLEHFETLSHKGAAFVCPALNGVAACGYSVAALSVTNVIDPRLSVKT